MLGRRWNGIVPVTALAALALALALALAVGGWYRLAGPDDADRAPAFDPSASATQDSAAPVNPSGAAWLSWPLPGDSARAPAPVLATRLQGLAASADPRDAWQAYRLVRACLDLRSRTLRVPDLSAPGETPPLAGIRDRARFCDGVTERMRMDSLSWLERAARAGVDGAIVALVEEGPFGDPSALDTRPDDPLVKEWKDKVARLLGEQAGRGNWASLYLLFTGFTFNNPAIAVDRQSALAYGLALRDIVVKVDGLTEDEAIPFNGPFLDQVRAGLTREQEAQASTQAAAIVDVALRQRGQVARVRGSPGI